MNGKYYKWNPSFIERIECDNCGWYNNKPSKAHEKHARCKKCGKLIDQKERFIEEIHKEMKEHGKNNRGNSITRKRIIKY